MCAPIAVTAGSGISAAGAVLMSQIMALAVLSGIFIVNFRKEIKQVVTRA